MAWITEYEKKNIKIKIIWNARRVFSLNFCICLNEKYTNLLFYYFLWKLLCFHYYFLLLHSAFWENVKESVLRSFFGVHDLVEFLCEILHVEKIFDISSFIILTSNINPPPLATKYLKHQPKASKNPKTTRIIKSTLLMKQLKISRTKKSTLSTIVLNLLQLK